MARRDDEKKFGTEISSSSSDQFTRADRGEVEALRRELERTQGRTVTGQEATQHLQELRQGMAGKQDEEKKRQERAARDEEQRPLHAETKTRKEEEQEQIITADQQQSPEQMIEEAKRQEEEQRQADAEYTQQMG
ncbi:MAG: hypothetical protein PHO92_01945 [Candidatus Peribacteraceae bacterium]|nr:hypothetical protein [Candidatus Peribacteraceae bacterium]